MKTVNQNNNAVLECFYSEVDRWVDMPKLEWDLLLPYMKVMSIEEKTELQSIGDNVSVFNFLYSGLVRYYYLNEQGQERNKAFYREMWLLGNLSAVIMEECSRFAIETLEPSVVVQYPISALKSIMLESPAWTRLFNRSCQLMLVRNERREAELLSDSSKDRYLQFLKNFHDLEGRIPQYHIASYLGITPVALSRYKTLWLS